MKKVSVVIGSLVLLICTGCSKTETLKCTQDSSSEGMSLIQTMNVTLKNSVVTEIEFGSDIVLEDSYMDYMEVTKKSLEGEYDVYKEIKGVKVNTKQKDNKITTMVSVKLNQVSEEDKKKYAWNYGKQTIENLKAEFENQNFTCQ